MNITVLQSTTYRNHVVRPELPTKESVVVSESLDRIVERNTAVIFQPSKSRKRVRFDEQEPERVKVRVLEILRPSSEMTHEEKDSIWYHKLHFQENVKNARFAANLLAFQTQIDCDANNYSEALASTYASCTIDDNGQSELSENCARHLALVSTINSTSDQAESARGLEKAAFPLVGREAVRRRNDAIGSVLMAQIALNQGLPSNEKNELIRRISEEQSKCARRFAKAMGTADAMLALIEYGTTPLFRPSTS